MSENASETKIIGWREWLALPDIGVYLIKAKIDTGARSSALHTHDYQVFQEDGRERVRFHVHPRKKSPREVECVADVVDFREVRDSGGHVERRPFIRTTVHLGDGFRWQVDMSLTNREQMKFRMLLGRQALAAGGLLVDPARSYYFGKPKGDA